MSTASPQSSKYNHFHLEGKAKKSLHLELNFPDPKRMSHINQILDPSRLCLTGLRYPGMDNTVPKTCYLKILLAGDAGD